MIGRDVLLASYDKVLWAKCRWSSSLMTIGIVREAEVDVSVRRVLCRLTRSGVHALLDGIVRQPLVRRRPCCRYRA